MIRLLCSLSFFTILLLSSCSRKIHANADSSGDPGKGSLNLAGSWELHSRYGGNRAGNNTEVQPGNGDVYKFVKDHFEHYENHRLLDSGKYSLATSKGPEGGEPLPTLVFHGTDTVRFALQKDTLILNPGAPMYDGIATKYVRVYLH